MSKTDTIELPDDLRAEAEDQVRKGRYANIVDMVRDAFSALEERGKKTDDEKLAALREALDVGITQLEAGQVIEGTPAEHMGRIRKRHGMTRGA